MCILLVRKETQWNSLGLAADLCQALIFEIPQVESLPPRETARVQEDRT